MANEQNLKPGGYKFTDEDRRKAARKRHENVKRRKTIREAMEDLLAKDFKTADGRTMSGTEAIVAKAFQQALDGNLEAFKTVRDSVGEKPVERVMVAEVDPDIISEVESAVLGDNDGNTDDENAGD